MSSGPQVVRAQDQAAAEMTDNSYKTGYDDEPTRVRYEPFAIQPAPTPAGTHTSIQSVTAL